MIPSYASVLNVCMCMLSRVQLFVNVTDHALITWLSCTAPVADHAMITQLPCTGHMTDPALIT